MIGKLHTHGFNGYCDPVSGREKMAFTQKSFSLGIFEWIPTADGKGVKRGPVKVRVKGPCCDRDVVYQYAKEIAEDLDNGAYIGPRTFTVK